MANEIITTIELRQGSNTFADVRLREATDRINAIYSDAKMFAEAKNREIASILSMVQAEKLYVNDGFKSVAEYANAAFGMGKANAYALARAGDFYNNPAVPDKVKAFSPHKLAELAQAPADVIDKAVESGEITPDTTEKAIREYVEPHKKRKKDTPKASVVDMYTARLACFVTPDDIADELMTPRTLDEWDSFFTGYITRKWEEHFKPDIEPYTSGHTVECIKIPKALATEDSTKPTITRRLYCDRNMSMVIEFFIYRSAKKETDNKRKLNVADFSIEQLEALLAQRRAEMESGG